MLYYSLFTLLTYLSVVLGVATLATSEDRYLYLLITVAAGGLAWRSDRVGRPVPVIGRVATAVPLLAVALVEYLGDPVATLGLGHLLNFAMVLKLTTVKGPRDYLQIYLMGLFEVIVGGYFSSQLVFGVLLVAFVVATGWALMLLVMTSGSQLWVRSRPSDYAPRALNVGRLAAMDQGVGVSRRRFLARTGWFTPALLVPAVLVFILVPRGQRQRFGFAGGGRYQSITGFKDTVELGSMANILQNPAIVMRIRLTDEATRTPLDHPGVPLLWRGLTLDQYTGRDGTTWTWHKSMADRQERYFVEGRLNPDVDYSSQRLIRQNILLEPIESPYLFMLSPAVQIKSASLGPLNRHLDDGAIRAVDPPAGLRQYEAVSARYPIPPRHNDRPVHRTYTDVPDDPIRADLTRIAHEAAPDDLYPTDLAKCGAIERYLRSDAFTYSLTYRGTRGAEPVTEFLTKTRTGHCELFASSMALLLRTCNIPTRVVNGFRGGEWNLGGYLIVRQQDAHSWVEAWLPGQGWRAFDPTPGAAGAERVPSPTLAHYLSQVYDYLKWSWVQNVMNYGQDQQTDLVRAVGDLAALGRTVVAWNRQTLHIAWQTWEKAVGGASIRFGLGRRAARPIAAVLGALVLAAAGLTVVAIARRLARRGRLPDAPVEFYRTLLRVLARLGFARGPAQTPMEFAAAVAAAAPEHLRTVTWVTEQYYLVRFGGRSLTPDDRRRIRDALDHLAAVKSGRRGGGSRE